LRFWKKKMTEEEKKEFEEKISADPSDYGSKGENWARTFVIYMKAIVTHPVFEGMPDAVKEDGKIQWEAPSNRSGGKYQFTHQKRRDWWESKAKSIGINTTEDKWISRTAKRIHPTGEKPCKRCGTILRIAYVYPKATLIKRIKKELGEGFEVSSLDPINEIIQRAHAEIGNGSILLFKDILTTSSLSVPNFNEDINALLAWLEEEYIPKESTLLSPGVMSNAPDRFEGFHSFNRCCRGKADKGRSANNLKSYSTDRRVFEYWSEGDWIAADRLMGLVRTVLSSELNADGGEGNPTADHIGPLSLGFCHRPEFRLLSKSANSAKNNRMTTQDVTDLIHSESAGIKVASWYAKPLWDLRKNDIKTEENALRLSKMLRDNQRNAMVMLSKLLDKQGFIFLVYLLELDFASYKVEFENLRAEKYITVYDSVIKEDRNTKYSVEQKARRLRIGFEALKSYTEKENRHLFVIDIDSLELAVQEANTYLAKEGLEYAELNKLIEEVLMPKSGVISDRLIRELIPQIPTGRVEVFENAKMILGKEMDKIANKISEMWESDRYVREKFELD